MTFKPVLLDLHRGLPSGEGGRNRRRGRIVRREGQEEAKRGICERGRPFGGCSGSATRDSNDNGDGRFDKFGY
eukprot:12335141-Prorocentrum_lima.AAC.1